MGESNIRNYQVNYAINAEGNAPQYFLKMAENTEKMMQPLNALQSQINAINRSLRILGQNENLKNLFALKPTLDISALKTSLAEAEKLVEASADRMAAKLNTALASAAASKSSAKIKSAKALDASAVKAQMEKLEKDFLLASGGKPMSKVKGRDDTTTSAWSIREDYNKLKKRLADMQTKMTKTSSNIIGSVKKAEEIEKSATAINNLNAAVKGFNNRKAIKVKIDADASKAIATFNAFLKQVQGTIVSLPLAIETAANKGKKGKGKTGTKASSTTIPATPENVANLIKGKEKAVTITGQFNEGNLVAQLTASLGKLQELATSKPVIIRSVFNGGDAAFQLHQSITNLQKLADTKPIILKATTTAATPAPNDGTVATTPTTTTKDGKGTTQTSSTKWTNATQSQINAYTRHQQAMSDMRINSAVDLIKQKSKMQAATHAANQTMYDQLFGREAMHQKWVERDAAGESTRAKRNAVREAISNRAALNAAQHNARELQRLRQLSLQSTPIVESEQAARSRYYSSSGGGRRYSVARPKDDLYTRSRAFWYPFTGNTSFGARTPMAVDMAKGMGTMFAIGGAMSAVGSSLNQAVEYQNIMKTTNAILKNGTDTYTSGGFKGMEQIVRQVGKDTKFTAPQVASAAKFLAMAGYDIPAINQAIKPVSNIALIGDTDLGATADKLTNVMTTFGIAPAKMGEIADIMTTTFTRSNTDMMMLAESAKYAGGIANLYGGSFKNNFADVMAMFGVLGNAGIQASSAGTTLRMMYQNLMQPNKNQRATLKQYGIYTRDTKGNPLEMIDILKQINAKVPKAQLADAIGNMFRITAQPGAAALATHLDGSNGLISLMQANRTSAGSGISESIANEKKNTMAGLWAQVQSTFTEGVLQAFEGKEGGWAGMLVQLRDYLAQPETVEMLRSIIDMVENLAKIMGNFAKIYAKVYNMFPDVFNFWIKAQLAFTQFGYLVTPVIQLIGVLSMLKTALIGTSAAATTATVVENTMNRTRKASSAVGALAGFTPRYANYIQSGNAAANYVAYTSGMTYWVGKRSAMKNIANLHGGKAMSALNGIPDSTWWAIAATNPALASAIKSNPAVGLQMYADKYKNSVVATEYAKATRAAHYAAFADNKVSATRAQYFDQLRTIRRPEQLGNRALMERYAAMGGDAALIAQSRAIIAERDARIAPIAAARHASRGVVASDVRERFAKIHGWKSGAKMTWGTSFKAGQALGTLSLASMIGSIKSMALSLFSGLAKTIGMLTSPIGLVTLAVGTAVTATLWQINRIKKKQAESDKIAQDNAVKAHKAREEAYKPIEELNKKYRTIGDTLQPIEDSESVKTTKIAKARYAQFLDAFDTNASDKEAQKGWFIDILNNRNAALAFGGGSLSYQKGRNISNKRAFDESVNYNVKDPDAGMLFDQIQNANNYNGAQSRAWESVFLAGATDNQVQKAVNKIAQLREQLIAKQISQNDFYKKANDIRQSVANPNAKGLIDVTQYNVEEIKNHKDWSQFSQFQQGGWNVLTAELNADIGSLNGYLQGVAQLKQGVKQYTEQWWGAVARVYDGLKYPLEIAGKTTNIVLKALPNGRINTSLIIQQIQQIAENLQLNISDFAKMAASVYEAMAKIGVVPGNYYSDYRKFTYEQTRHSAVTATDAGLYFDQYIAKGDKNATWGGLNRQQYIDYVKSDSGNKGRAAKERVMIRKTMSNAAADNAKRLHDKTMQTVNKATGGKSQLNQGSTAGTVGGTDKDKSKNQKEYANTYDRSAARPTQVIINIDNLARFDRTAIAKNADDRAVIEAIENKIAEAITMLSSQALNSAGSLIAQNI